MGVGDQGNHHTPVQLSYLTDISISFISAGAAHSVAVSGTSALITSHPQITNHISYFTFHMSHSKGLAQNYH